MALCITLFQFSTISFAHVKILSGKMYCTEKNAIFLTKFNYAKSCMQFPTDILSVETFLIICGLTYKIFNCANKGFRRFIFRINVSSCTKVSKLEPIAVSGWVRERKQFILDKVNIVCIVLIAYLHIYMNYILHK